MEQEIGHFETCSSITNTYPYTASYANGQTFDDPNTAQTCVGGFEGRGKVGEGPCNATTGICQNATTEGGGACPSDNFTSGALCEFSDMTCAPAGPRPINVNGAAETVSWPIAGCQDNYFQNGDLDFDGSSYIKDWPDGSPNHPTSFAYIGPFSHGKSYPKIQFETDIAGSEADCNVTTGAGCTAPPTGAKFYAFWSLSHGATTWAVYGTSVIVIPGRTLTDVRRRRAVRHARRGQVRRDADQSGAGQPADQAELLIRRAGQAETWR